ncbi:MAG: CBS domain-containing protein [Bryocella sp.]
MFRTSIPLGKILGIDLRLHTSLPLLLIAAALYSEAVTGGVWRGLALWAALVFAVVVREVARTIAVAYTQLRLRALFLLPVGGVMALVQRDPRDPNAAVLPKPIMLVAPLANVAMGLLLMGLAYAIDPHVRLFVQPWISIHHILNSFIWLQFVMAVINLLPTSTVQAQQIFRARTASQPRGARASGTRTAIPRFTMGTGLALMLIFSGFLLMNYWPMNLWLIIAGAFMLFGTHMRTSQALNGTDADSILVSDVMLTEYMPLSSSDTLSSALSQTVHSLQDVFPVLRGNRLVGSVSRQNIANALDQQGDSYLQGIMTRNLHIAGPQEKVLSVLQRAGLAGAGEFVPVVEGNQMLGILTPQALSRAVHQVRQARARTAVQERRDH